MRRATMVSTSVTAIAAVTLVLAPAAAESGSLYRDDDGEHELCDDDEYPVYRDVNHRDIAGCEMAVGGDAEQPSSGDESESEEGSATAGDASDAGEETGSAGEESDAGEETGSGGEEPDAGEETGSEGDEPEQGGSLYRDYDGEHELCDDDEYPVYRDVNHRDIAGCEMA